MISILLEDCLFCFELIALLCRSGVEYLLIRGYSLLEFLFVTAMNCMMQASSQGLRSSCTGPGVSIAGERRHQVASTGFARGGAAERSCHLVEGRSRKFNRKLLPMATTTFQNGQSSSPAHRSAQFLSEQGFMEIPNAYVRAPEERSNLRESVAQGVPVIDLATATPAEIGEACTQWGLFQVVNHGVPLKLMERIREVCKQFFAKPVEEKLAYAASQETLMQGYGVRFGNSMQDWRDFFLHHTLPLSRRNPNLWPSEPADYRSTVLEYSNEAIKLQRRLLGLMSTNLGLEPSFLEEALGDPNQSIFVNYYPACPQPDLALGLQAHSDNGAITVLLQDDVPGLQVLRDGKWSTVQHIPGSLIINMGDMSQILTNGIYKSVVHRAIVNKEKPRMSVVSFYNTQGDRPISPAKPLVNADRPAVYRSVTFNEHFQNFVSRGRNISLEGVRNIDLYKI